MRLENSENGEDRPPGVEDMIKLQDLNEQSLLRNIKVRYEKELIYTYTGSILVAVNPYKMFNIYGLDKVKQYEGKVLGAEPPHLFAIGSSCLSKMINDRQNQVIVISGESGAGKTESTKLIMQYLAAVDKASDNLITEQILEASPLLESFGNAKTTRNDNSSRFGKYVEVYFRGGCIVGAKTSEYLLEKSRIAKQAEEERNYHVFYEMLAGLSSEKKKFLGLTQAEKYFYLNQGGNGVIPSKDDKADFYDLQSAMEVLGLTSLEQDMISKVLASILHMGNIFFRKKQNTHQHESVEMGGDAEIKWVSHLLDLSKDWLQEGLTMKVTEARRERLLTPLTIDQALDARDGISKALYQRLFTWLVEKVNLIVAGKEQDRARATSIALLDIFGFEDFQVNSFEQLCINYANETLQFYFNKHVFRLEQAEYARERIDWTVIEFTDNQPTIELVAKKPYGVVHILDDESNFPKGTDQSFLDKCHYTHESNRFYTKPRLSGNEFCIHHYAGRVTYSVTGFLDKNRDTLRSDVMEMMIKSRNVIISQMFRDLREVTLNRTVARQGFYVTMKPRTATVAASFHESLISLVDTMARCRPWFVRCIKPNNYKAPMEFQTQVVLTQLRYTGMLETIRIRKMGYPVRHQIKDFADRYHALLVDKQRTGHRWEDKQVCEKILYNLGPQWKNAWQIGISKVFLKEALSHYLDSEKQEVLLKKVLIIQTFARGFLARKDYHKARDAAILLQAGIRAWVAKHRFHKMREGFIRTQAQYRMVQQRRTYLRMREGSKRYRTPSLYERQLEQRPVARQLSERPCPLSRSRLEMYEHTRTIRPITRKDLRDRQDIRGPRSGFNVNNLEIPADLAYVISKLGETPSQHTEGNIRSTSHVHPRHMDHELPEDIDSYAFNKYVNIYFKERWPTKREPITAALLSKHKDKDTKDAIAIFRLILRFMNDSNLSGEREKLIADYIVQKGMSNENLRDEIFAQLCNQTWLTQSEIPVCERGWILMSHALSSFSPSANLSKYLLKYVSDQGFDGYKSYCQQKLLHSLILDPQLPRYYPPSLLEWNSTRKRSQMAIVVHLPDGDVMNGPVDSWTTGEDFVSHLLRQRQLSEGDHGWTVVLKDDKDVYELMGYDYVLDLLSEMEVGRGFPYTLAPFMVTSDHSKESSHERKAMLKDRPHNPDLPRLVDLTTEELRDPIPVEPRPAPEVQSFFRTFSRDSIATEDNPYASQDGLSRSSRLNNRSISRLDEPALSSTSLLNVRYTNQNPASPTSPVPPSVSPTEHPLAGGSKPPSGRLSATSDPDLSLSRLNNRYNKSPTPETPPVSPEPAKLGLAPSKLNKRYNAPTGSSGSLHNGMNGDVNGLEDGAEDEGEVPLSASRINLRYRKDDTIRPPPSPGRDRADTSSRRSRYDSSRYGSEKADRMSTGPSDMDRWVDDVFDPILLSNLDDLSDARRVESRLKGGGKGIPGLTSQPGPYNPTSLQNGTMPIIASGAVTTFPTMGIDPTAATTSMSIPPLMPNPSQMIANQMAAVQQQSLMQTQAQQIQQAQQAQMAATNLKLQIMEKDLENELLVKSYQQEQLKQQLTSLQQATQPPPPQQQPTWQQPPVQKMQHSQPEVPPQDPIQSRPRSTSPITAALVPEQPVVMRDVTRQAPSGPPGDVRQNTRGASGEIDTSRQGGVKTLKKKLEVLTKPKVSPTMYRRGSGKRDSGEGQDRDSKVQFDDQIQHIPTSPPSRSPPPSTSNTDDPSKSEISPPPPPAPPPAPSSDDQPQSPSRAEPQGETSPQSEPVASGSTNGEPQTYTRRTFQWPPPKDEEVKESKQPGKLRITQKIIGDGRKPQSASVEDAHARVIQALKLVNGEPEEEKKPEVKKGTHTKIDMKKRRQALEDKLNMSKKSTEDPVPKAPPPPPPPIPLHIQPGVVPPPPSMPEPTEDEVDYQDVVPDIKELEKMKTKLFSVEHGPYLTYTKVPWTLNIRKEVFTPTEVLESPTLIHLIFCQITLDVFSNACIRIPKEEKTRMRGMLENNGISVENVYDNQNLQLKKRVIEAARDWPYYFARLFPVNGGRKNAAVQIVGVSHSGVKLLAREKDLVEDNLLVIDQFKFSEIIDISEPKPCVLQIHINNDYIIVYTPRAGQIKHMIDAYTIESEKDVVYVRAIRDYLTRDPTLLRLHKDDIIKLTNREMALDKGWLYGSLHGRTGLFPAEYVKPLARHELDKYQTAPKPQTPTKPPSPTVVEKPPNWDPPPNREPSDAGRREDIYSDASIYSQMPEVQKFSMMEFAMLHFRQSPFRYEMVRSPETGSIHGTFKMISSLKAKTMQREQSKKGGKDWTWKQQADMIKWTKSPIQASLLKFESPQMNKLALESFIAIMRYMGDYPLGRGQKPIDCVYTILRACHNFPELRDEVYCQLAKQTTSNRSTKPESLQQGWRLMCIITAYFDCTETLRPYLFKYLETTALDPQRPHHALGAQSLQNLRQTFRYGGRKNVPSRVELEALTRGRNTKRQMCVMPGGMPVMLNIRSCSVVLDAIDQICSRLDIRDPLEKEEFTIFYVIESGSRYLTLNRDEYIFDITTELANQRKEFYLLFQRTSWVFPLHLDNNQLYIDVMYHQCIPDYLDGFLLPMPTSSLPDHVKNEIALLGALQIRASELPNLPRQRDVMAVVPKTAHNVSGANWMSLVERELREMHGLNPSRAKIIFLDKLSRWPLFGSTFFNIKSVTDPRIKGECLLAINKAGVHFLHHNTHETLVAYPFNEVVSSRRFRSKEGKNHLEMKVGNLMHQKVTRIETDQGVDISALIGQYIHILKKVRI